MQNHHQQQKESKSSTATPQGNQHIKEGTPRAEVLLSCNGGGHLRQQKMREPRIELGAQRWQRWILPLNHSRLFTLAISDES